MSARTKAGAAPSSGVRLAAALTLLVIVLVTAISCGDTGINDAQPTTANDSSASTEPTTDPQDGSSEGSGGSLPVGDTVEPGQALIVSTSNVDGATSELASALVDDRAVDDFLADADPRLAADVRAAVDEVKVPAGSTLFGSVVAVGCDEPASVSWVKTFDGVEASAHLPKSTVQCLVPVTSVALFLVEDSV